MNIASFLVLFASFCVITCSDLKKSRLSSPFISELPFNREVTLSDAEQYFYKNIFRYLDEKFKGVDSKLVTVGAMNKSIETLHAGISNLQASCLEAHQSAPVAKSLQGR